MVGLPLSRRGRRRKKTRRQKNRTHTLQPLEVRRLLAIDVTFEEGHLSLVSDAADPIVVSHSGGFVKLNDEDPPAGPILAADVQTLFVQGGPGGSLIDLEQVNAVGFPQLQDIVIHAGPQPDAQEELSETEATVDAYGLALAGENWDSLFGMSKTEVATAFLGDTWESTWEAHPWYSTYQPMIEGFGTEHFLVVIEEYVQEQGYLPHDEDEEEEGGGESGIESSGSVTYGSPLADNWTGSSEGDTYYGCGGDDTINGGDGDDELYGGTGSDDIDGGEGSDTIHGGDGGDTLSGGEGKKGSSGSTDDKDVIYGGKGGDDIGGGEGNDSIYGGDDNDIIRGARGDDSLYGGNGTDTLTGDLDGSDDGSDSFFGPASEATDYDPQEDTLSATEDTSNGDDGMPAECDLPIINITASTNVLYELDPEPGNPSPHWELPEFIVTFTVTPSKSSTLQMRVNYATDGPPDGPFTAKGVGDPDPFYDYLDTLGGEFIWQPGETHSQTFTVQLLHNEWAEFDEIFWGQLAGPVNAVLGIDRAEVLIIDDDIRKNDDDGTIECIACACDCRDTLNNDRVNGADGGLDIDYIPMIYTTASLSYAGTSNPHPVIPVDIELPSYEPFPGKELKAVEAVLTFAGQEDAPVYFVPGAGQGDPSTEMRFVLQADATSLPSGTYDYEIKYTAFYDFPSGTGVDAESVDFTVVGSRAIVNRAVSEFGSRWYVAGAEPIYFGATEEDGFTISRSSSAPTHIENTGGTGMSAVFVTSPGYFDDFVPNVDGTISRIDKFGTEEIYAGFAALVPGLLLARIDRNGNRTDYAYIDADGDGDADELSTITDPYGLVTTFLYHDSQQPNYGLLKTIRDFAGRDTDIETQQDAGGRWLLTKITSPDPDDPGTGAEPLVTEYQYYAGTGLMHKLIRPGDETTEYFYDHAGRVTKVRYDDGEEVDYETIRVQGLPDVASGEGSQLNPFTTLSPEVVQGKVTNDIGAEVTYSVDRFGQFTEGTDGLGNQFEYERDANGLATKMTWPDPDGSSGPLQSSEWNYAYDMDGNIITITHPGNAVEQWTYDGTFSEVTYYSDELGRETYFDVDLATGDVTKITRVVGILDSASGGQEDDDVLMQFTYTPPPQGAGDLPGGLVTQVTDAEGRMTKYEYYDNPAIGDFGLLKKVIFAFGSTEEAEAEFFYDPVSRTLSAIEDELNRRTEYEYDKLDRVIKRIDPDPDYNPATQQDGPLSSPVWTYEYCECSGKLTKTTDPLGNTTEYIYDDRYRLEQVILTEPEQGAGSPTWTYGYDAIGRLETTTDPLGRVITHEYDLANRLIKVIHPDPDFDPSTQQNGPLQSPEWTYTYDNTNQLLSVTDSRQNTTNYEYDNRFRLTKMIQPDPTGSAGRPEWEYIYDAAGQRTATHDPLDRITAVEYDDLGRVIKTTEPDPDGAGSQVSSITTYAYDDVSNLRFVTDPLSHVTEHVYDARNRRTKEIDPDLGETLLAYDDVGNRLSLTDPEGNTTTWTYDGLDRVVQETNELNHSRFFEYDTIGNLTKRTDRLGRVISFDYDDLYRLTAERWLDGQGATMHTITYDYDLVGRLISISDPSATYDYVYDQLNRATASTQTIASLTPSVVFASQYDANGNRTQLAASIGATEDFVNDYVYDALNRLTRLEQRGVTGGNSVADKRIDFEYNLASQLTGIDRYADLAAAESIADTTYGYDGAGRLTSILHDLNSQTLTDISYTYGYDLADRITSITFSHDDDATYTYDDRDQLTDESYADTSRDVAYTYDANGNRVTVDGTPWTTNADNQLYRDDTYEYEYDAEGNRTKRVTLVGGQPTGATTEYEWDYRNRLVKVTDRVSPNGATTKIVEYSYDAFDRRIGKQVDIDGDSSFDRAEAYIWEDDQVVFDFLDDDASDGLDDLALVQRFLNGPAIDQILAQEDAATGDVYWLLADHIGTIRDVVGYDDVASEASHLEHYEYDAFGNLVAITDAMGNLLSTDRATAVSRFQFTGREWDTDVALQYNRQRWYDPATGRWISEDPIGFVAGDANLNRYVANSVTTATDPSGLSIWTKILEAARKHKNSKKIIGILTELQQKAEARAEALKQLAELRRKLDKCTGPKTRDPVKDEIENLLKDIKNHDKKISQLRQALKKRGFHIDDVDWQIMFPAVAFVVFPTTYEFWCNEHAPWWSVPVGVCYDIVKWVDPVGLSDFIESCLEAGSEQRPPIWADEDINDFPTYCFTAGTEVHLANGTTKPIEQLCVGDVVLSRSVDDSTNVKGRVVRRFQAESDHSYELQVDGERVTTTAGHPFFVEGKGWVCVKDLVVGDKLVDKSGMSEEIDSILRRDEPVSVYNMSVESYENYFVGSRGFLVHNKTVTGPRR